MGSGGWFVVGYFVGMGTLIVIAFLMKWPKYWNAQNDEKVKS